MQESGETYLETILILEKEKGRVYSVDVARALSYTKPSVSRGISLLVKEGYVAFGEDKRLVFTEEGRERAERIYERHLTLTRFLQGIPGVDEETAAENACRMEHIITEELFLKIREYVGREP